MMGRCFTVRQTVKNGNQADFVIEDDKMSIGELHYTRHGIVDGAWNGQILGYRVLADHLCRKDRTRHAFGVFRLELPDGNKGLVYSTYEGGFLSRFTIYQLKTPEGKYQMYDVAMGKEGVKFPVWHGDTQIALAEKPVTVHDSLYTFDVTAVDDKSAYLCVLLLLCLYVRKYFEPSTVYVHSVQTETGMTVNKSLRARYDSSFVKKYR